MVERQTVRSVTNDRGTVKPLQDEYRADTCPPRYLNHRNLGFAVPHLTLTALTLLAELAGEAGTHRDAPGKESWN